MNDIGQDTARINANLSELDLSLDRITHATQRFGSVFSSTISGAIIQGKSFEQTLDSIAKRFIDIALRQSIAPLEKTLGSLMGNFVGQFSSGFGGFSKPGAAPVSSLSTLPAAPPVVFNVATQNASSFSKSQSQISAMLARTVARGQRRI